MALIPISTTFGDTEVIGASGVIRIITNKRVIEVELHVTGGRLVVNPAFITAHDAVGFSPHIGGLSLRNSVWNVSVPHAVYERAKAAVEVLAGVVHNGDVGGAGRHFGSPEREDIM